MNNKKLARKKAVKAEYKKRDDYNEPDACFGGHISFSLVFYVIAVFWGIYLLCEAVKVL